MGVTVQQTAYELLEAGEYPATIVEVLAEEGQFGPQLKFKFQLDDGRTLLGWCSQTFSPKSKLYNWTKAAFGGSEIPRTYNLNTDHLQGRGVRLFVTVEPGRDGEYNKISNVLPVRRSTNGTTPPPAPAPASTFPPPEREEVPF